MLQMQSQQMQQLLATLTGLLPFALANPSNEAKT